MNRWELRAAAARWDYAGLAYLARHADCPPMHRAEARREMKRRDRLDAAWLAGFIRRLAS